MVQDPDVAKDKKRSWMVGRKSQIFCPQELACT